MGGMIKFLSLFWLVFLSFGCMNAEIVDDGKVTNTQALDRVSNIEISGYQFDLPDGHRQYATGGYNDNNQLQAVSLTYRISGDFSIEGAESANVHIFNVSCQSHTKLSSRRSNSYLMENWMTSTSPEFHQESRIAHRSYAYISSNHFVYEVIFEKRKSNCLVIKTSVVRNNSSFNTKRLGDLDHVLRVVFRSLHVI